jgi:membrane protein implicated in regulation of membrane protease activity
MKPQTMYLFAFPLGALGVFLFGLGWHIPGVICGIGAIALVIASRRAVVAQYKAPKSSETEPSRKE